MKKLMVVQHIGEVGGSGIGLLAILNMIRTRFNIVVYCIKEPDALTKRLIENGFTVKTCQSIPLFGYLSGGPGFLSIDFLLPLSRINKGKAEWKNIIRNEKPDYVLVNSMVLSWMWSAIKGCDNTKALCYVREVLPNRWDPRSHYVIRNLEKFDAVWFISNNERQFFNLKYPLTYVIRDSLTGKKTNLTENCIHFHHKDTFHALYVGGASRLKGIETLMSSIKYLAPHITVDIAGNVFESFYFKGKATSFWETLKELAFRIRTIPRIRTQKKLLYLQKKYPNRINLIGHQDNLDHMYKNCDVLLFPSRKPHQARPAFEAGFYGKPVIISDFKQTAENVRNEYNGLTFKPRNPKALADAVNRLFWDEKLRYRLGENNRYEANKKHTYDTVNIEMDRFWSKFSL